MYRRPKRYTEDNQKNLRDHEVYYDWLIFDLTGDCWYMHLPDIATISEKIVLIVYITKFFPYSLYN